MKTSSAELKRTARENLSGKYGVAILLQITPVTAVHHKRQFIIWLLLLLLCFS